MARRRSTRRRTPVRASAPRSKSLSEDVEELKAQLRFLRLIVSDMRRRMNVEDFAERLASDPKMQRDQGERDE